MSNRDDDAIDAAIEEAQAANREWAEQQIQATIDEYRPEIIAVMENFLLAHGIDPNDLPPATPAD